MEKAEKTRIARLIGRAASRHDAVREEATQEFERLGSDGAKALLETYYAGPFDTRLSSHWICILLCILFWICALLGGLIYIQPGGNRWQCIVPSVLCCGLAFAQLVYVVISGERYARGMSFLLSHSQHPTTLFPLFDLTGKNVHVKTRDLAIDRAIIRLLERLKPSDAGWITPEHQTKICARLEIFAPHQGLVWDVSAYDYCRALLFALAQVGDAKAVPCLERVAHSAVDRRIRLGAEDCLSQLRTRPTSTDHMLLRASSASGFSPAGLLRAASGGDLGAEQDLLRGSRNAQTDSL